MLSLIDPAIVLVYVVCGLFEVNLQVFLLFVYICITIEDPIIKSETVGIPLTSLILSHFCACPKPGLGCRGLMFNELGWEVVAHFVDIGVEHHCLISLFLMIYKYHAQPWKPHRHQVFFSVNSLLKIWHWWGIGLGLWCLMPLSVLLLEEIGVPGENHRPAESHWQTWSHNVVSSTLRLSGIWTHNISGDRY